MRNEQPLAAETPRVLRWQKAKVRGDAWSPIYEAYDAHGLAGSAVQTGRRGVDDYPWDWGIDPLYPAPEGVRVKTSGVADTLRAAKDQAEYAARMRR